MWADCFRDNILTVRLVGEELDDEIQVYLAGLISRERDLEYKIDSQKFLIEDVEILFDMARRHDPYIGQNAPVFYIARINAEHHLFRSSERELQIPAIYFDFAAKYASRKPLRDIYAYFRAHIPVVHAVLKKIQNFD